MNIVNRRHQNCKKHDRNINAIIKFGPQKCRQQTVTGFENSFVYCWSSSIFTGPSLFTSDRLRKGISYVHTQCIYWCWLCLKQHYSHLTPDGKKNSRKYITLCTTFPMSYTLLVDTGVWAYWYTTTSTYSRYCVSLEICV